MRRKQYPKRWRKQWFVIELYKPIGLLRREKFFVRATTYKTAIRKLAERYPNINGLILCVGPMGAADD